jgi:hypothetical protein
VAKKTRRARKARQQIRLSSAQMRQPDSDRSWPAIVSSTGPGALDHVDLTEQYGYVVADLKRIGVLAAVMLAVLVIAALTLS